MKRNHETPAVLRYSELIATLAKQLKQPKVKVKTVIDGMISLAAQELKNGKFVQIGELGRLRLRDVVAPAEDGVKEARVPSKRVVLAVAKKFRAIAEM